MTRAPEHLDAAVRGAIERLAGAPVASIEPLGGGRNSRVYWVFSPDGRTWAAKHYFRHPADARDRLRVEFSALKFLRAEGLRSVPEPIAQDPAAGVALYEFIVGSRIESPDAVDIDTAADFLKALRALAESGRGAEFGPASDACISPEHFLRQIKGRLARLESVERDFPALADFLGRFRPGLERVESWVREAAKARGVAFESTLGAEERTLSPSDFGTHNALRLTGDAEASRGSLVFLDFEYFGWDDPAKMLADFTLHPAMALPDALSGRFLARLTGAFGPGLEARLPLIRALCGLKWCLIFLNAFTPQDRARWEFADADAARRSTDLQMRQLDKADRMLDRALAAAAQ